MVNAKVVEAYGLANYQPSATTSTFQQMVTVNPAFYLTFLRADLGNIRFYRDKALTQPINSWLESGNSSSSSATFWLQLTQALPASSTTPVFLAILDTGTTFDGNIAGQAPQLSSTYAQFDNGSNVFSFYDNFAGNSISASWNTGGGAVVTVNNQLSFDPNNIPGIVFSLAAQSTGPLAVDSYQKVDTAADVKYSRLGNNFSNEQTNPFTNLTSGVLGWLFTGVNSTGAVGALWQLFDPVGGLATPRNGPVTDSTLQNFHVISLGMDSGHAYEMLDYNSSTAVTFTGNYTLTQFPGLSAHTLASPINYIVQWFRTRALPPNGVMPNSYRWVPPSLEEGDKLRQKFGLPFGI